MSAFYDLASLVLVPSGYKASKVYAQKPLTTDGQLAFSRASTATRVGPDGLIEKVRTNLATYSSDFSTAGLTIDATVSTNTTTDPFGTTLADSLLEAATTGNHLWYGDFTVSNGTELTFSIYVKSIGGRNVRVAGSTGTGSELAVVDLANGSILASSGAVSVTSAGSGWYRISLTTTTTGTTARFIVYAADGTSISYAGNTSKGVYLFGHQVEYGVMTDYIATTTAAVSVGPVANVPRLDYLGSSCPRLLLEPQRTNLSTYSEQINQWLQERTIVTANAITSPDGYTNADKVDANSAPDTTHQTYNGPYTNTAGNVAFSGFFKKGEYDWVHFGAGSANSKAWFNLNTGVVGSKQSDVVTTSMVDYGNGWYRCISVVNLATTSNYVEFGPASVDNSRVISGTPSGGIYGWGIQMENASSYATSYIGPTLGSASTRGSDAASKTGISSLIGQTEGTVMVEYNQSLIGQSATRRIFALSDGTSNNRITAYINSANGIDFYVRNSGGDLFLDQASSPIGNTKGVHKIAAAYKNGDYAVYLDGVQIISGAGTAGTIPACSRFDLGQQLLASDLHEPIMQAILFPTRLSNSDLAALTA